MSGLAVSAASSGRSNWAMAGAALAAGSLALLLLFRAEAAAAMQVWMESTAFGHCFLVIPIACWLAWERRHLLDGLAPEPWPAAALVMLPLGLVWFATALLGIMEGRQLVALAMLWTLGLSILGRQVAWAMVVPLAYLVFLVPFGAFLVPALQDFTARFIGAGLTILDIPHVVTATLIEIPEGSFQVAEACAGLRFLIAAIAFGTLYACVIYRSPGRRLAFIVVSTVVPVLANGVRALGIVLLGHLKGSAEAGAVDHVLYGWIFFSLVILLLLLLGLPFREDVLPFSRPDGGPPALPVQLGLVPLPARPAQPSPARLLLVALAASLLAAAGPAGAAWVQARAASTPAATAGPKVALVAGPGCVTAASPVATTQRFRCGDALIEARAQTFGPSAGPEILGVMRDALAASDTADHSVLLAGAVRWQIMAMRDPDRMVAAALWLDGAPAPDGLALRLALARHSLLGAEIQPVLVTVGASAVPAGLPPSTALVDVLASFLRAQSDALDTPSVSTGPP